MTSYDGSLVMLHSRKKSRRVRERNALRYAMRVFLVLLILFAIYVGWWIWAFNNYDPNSLDMFRT